MIHKCEKCEYSNVSKCRVRDHFNAVHLGLQPFECDVCGKRYTMKQSVTAHKKLEHSTGPKRAYDCNVCQKTFKDSSALKNHINVHETTEANFKCTS